MIDIDGVKIFHLGGMDPNSEVNLAGLKEMGIEKEGVDILLANDDILYNPALVKIIKDRIKPLQIIAMHIAPSGYKTVSVQCREQFPQTIFFRDSMERKIFIKREGVDRMIQ